MSEYGIKMNEVNQIIAQDGLKKWFGKNKDKDKKQKNKSKNNSENNNENSIDKSKSNNRDSFEKVFMDKINAERVKELINNS